MKEVCLARIVTLVVLIFTGMAVGGCGSKQQAASQNPPAPTNQSSQTESASPLTAPIDYVGAVGRAAQFSERTVDLVQVQNAVRQFQAAEGRNPSSLQELVQHGYLPRLPQPPRGMQFLYDPRTGQVRLVPSH